MKDEIGVRLDGINDKLDNMRREWKDDIGGLKRGQTNIWKELREINNRQTRTETRLERCSTLSDSGKDCPTTEKLKRLEKSGEKKKDRGLIVVGLLLTGIVGVSALVVDIALRLLI